jgi:hypothetical protein
VVAVVNVVVVLMKLLLSLLLVLRWCCCLSAVAFISDVAVAVDVVPAAAVVAAKDAPQRTWLKRAKGHHWNIVSHLACQTTTKTKERGGRERESEVIFSHNE